MRILNQDRDKFYNVTKVFYKRQNYRGKLVGWNIYGEIGTFRKCFLGTYDTEADAISTVNEINAMIRNNCEYGKMPELISFEFEEMLEN